MEILDVLDKWRTDMENAIKDNNDKQSKKINNIISICEKLIIEDKNIQKEFKENLKKQDEIRELQNKINNKMINELEKLNNKLDQYIVNNRNETVEKLVDIRKKMNQQKNELKNEFNDRIQSCNVVEQQKIMQATKLMVIWNNALSNLEEKIINYIDNKFIELTNI